VKIELSPGGSKGGGNGLTGLQVWDVRYLPFFGKFHPVGPVFVQSPGTGNRIFAAADILNPPIKYKNVIINLL
jgi:hypothetical protein